MQLLASWRDSLTIFRPANFKLFALVTLKSLIMTYQIWLKYWWWLIALFLIIQGLLYDAPDPFTLFSGKYSYDLFHSLIFKKIMPLPSFFLLLSSYLVLSLICATLFLSARPSMHLKNYAYYKHFFKYIVTLIIWCFLLSFFYYSASRFIVSAIGIAYDFFSILISFFFMAFLFDSDGSCAELLKSVWRAIQFVLYNLPACVLLTFLLFIPFFVHTVFIHSFFNTFEYAFIWLKIVAMPLLILVWLPLTVCIVINFYIKRLHEQFTVYFHRKGER